MFESQLYRLRHATDDKKIGRPFLKLVPITAFSQDELLLAYLKSKINSQSNPAVSVLYKQRSTYLQNLSYTENSRVDGPTVGRWSYGSAAAVNYRSESLHRVFE